MSRERRARCQKLPPEAAWSAKEEPKEARSASVTASSALGESSQWSEESARGGGPEEEWSEPQLEISFCIC